MSDPFAMAMTELMDSDTEPPAEVAPVGMAADEYAPREARKRDRPVPREAVRTRPRAKAKQKDRSAFTIMEPADIGDSCETVFVGAQPVTIWPQYRATSVPGRFVIISSKESWVEALLGVVRGRGSATTRLIAKSFTVAVKAMHHKFLKECASRRGDDIAVSRV